jgi:hypothetical protein
MSKEPFKNLVLVMNYIPVMAAETWVNFKKSGGSGSPSSSRLQTLKKFLFLMVRGGLHGTQTQLMFGYNTCTVYCQSSSMHCSVMATDIQ